MPRGLFFCPSHKSHLFFYHFYHKFFYLFLRFLFWLFRQFHKHHFLGRKDFQYNELSRKLIYLLQASLILKVHKWLWLHADQYHLDNWHESFLLQKIL